MLDGDLKFDMQKGQKSLKTYKINQMKKKEEEKKEYNYVHNKKKKNINEKTLWPVNNIASFLVTLT